MSNIPMILTALNVPTASPRPSINSVQCSKDGQIIIITKSAIYLLTPDLGINFDEMSLWRTPSDKEKPSKTTGSSVTLSWFRTLIELEKIPHHQWPSNTQEWGAVAVGSLDISWRAVAMSPSNLAPNAGCLLLAMNSNMEISLWHATKNLLKGEWIKIQDVTAVLKELPFITDEDESSHERRMYFQTLQAQILCMDWSSQPDFNICSRPRIDASLLALGNRAGSVVLMRYDGEMKHLSTVYICDSWVAQISWSSWIGVQPGKSEAFLACGISDGSIKLLKVTQWLEQVRALTSFGDGYIVQTKFELLNEMPASADGRGITALSWFQPADKLVSYNISFSRDANFVRLTRNHSNKPLLIHAKPGILRIWNMPLDTELGSKETVLRLQNQKTSVGSSSLAPVTGIAYVNDGDILIVSLSDGSFHVVHNASTAPILLDGNSMEFGDYQELNPNSAQLSRAARSVFVRAEGREIQYSDVHRINGSISFDQFNTVAWLHEACRPTDFNYKMEAQQQNMLVISQLFELPEKKSVIYRLKRLLIDQAKASEDVPIFTIRPILLQLRCLHSQNDFDALIPELLHILGLIVVSNDSFSQISTLWNGPLSTSGRAEFRRSLSKHLYGNKFLHSLRLGLAVADFCWRISSEEDVRKEFGQKAELIMQSITQSILRIFMEHFVPLTPLLTGEDMPFVRRAMAQSLLPGSSSELTSLADKIQNCVNSIPSDADLIEQCPACKAKITIESANAQCENGHIWVRCSITSFLLSTPSVRTCIGCARKALLPSSEGGTYNVSESLSWTKSWIVEDLLSAARRCLYCGNLFIRVL